MGYVEHQIGAANTGDVPSFIAESNLGGGFGGGIRLDEKQMRLNVHQLQVMLSESGPHPGKGLNWHGRFYGAEYAPQRLIEFGLMFLPDPWQHDKANQGVVKFFAVLN